MSKHKKISLVKSGIRLIGCGFGVVYFWHNFYPMHAFIFLGIAEVLGVIEEEFESK